MNAKHKNTKHKTSNEANKQTEGIIETRTNGNNKKGTSYDKKHARTNDMRAKNETP